ncbi:MAG: CAAX prenyl protease-related protein [Prosthecobacter sp.]|nr:CAAX prenyl protease-related protein [Prosthecobacter sp.]
MPDLPAMRRLSDTTAHVLPLAVFLALLAVPGWFRVENPELPWHQRAPEHWLYPLQTVLCGGLLLFFRRHYRLAPWRGLGLATGLALLGIAVWVAPAWLFERLAGDGPPPRWWAWFGMMERRQGFDPTVLAAWPLWEKAAILMRFVRMVVVVPLVEEVFWRGFLMRYAAAGDGRWQDVPFGTHSWRAFFIVTACVVLAHQPEDYLAAAIWGTLVYWLAVRSRSLGACVLMHAIGNLILGYYALATRQWGFW